MNTPQPLPVERKEAPDLLTASRTLLDAVRYGKGKISDAVLSLEGAMFRHENALEAAAMQPRDARALEVEALQKRVAELEELLQNKTAS